MPLPKVVIVGAGLAGLSCARSLTQSGANVVLLERSERPGGRVKTDLVDGFLLDRGFQVFLPAYPAARETLDYEKLDLKPFLRGAIIWRAGRFQSLIDPLSHPAYGLASLRHSTISMADRLRMLRLKASLASAADDDPKDDDQRSARSDLIEHWGFSQKSVRSFWEPFLGGVTLDPTLAASSRFVRFVLSMFIGGGAALPARGMEQIPRNIASDLPGDVLRTGIGAVGVRNGQVACTNGETLDCDAVVVATEAPSAARLLPDMVVPDMHSVTCIYYAADRAPIRKPALILNGDGTGPINNLAVVSAVAPDYAPAGKSLVSVTILDKESGPDLDRRVATQLEAWFGAEARRWHRLRQYRIDEALPSMATVTRRDPRYSPGVYVCGDYCDTASINGAIASGRRAAQCVMEDAV
jgi:phytoene dehydrogenase-like protein